jgi:RNA polymerase sigma factor (sigma-70 family)
LQGTDTTETRNLFFHLVSEVQEEAGEMAFRKGSYMRMPAPEQKGKQGKELMPAEVVHKRNEDVVFGEYAIAEGDAKKALGEELCKLLFQHALAICWLELREHRPDIANYSVFKAISYSKKFRGEARFSTWFHKIVLNQCKSRIRNKLRLAEKSLEDLNAGEEAVLAVASVADHKLQFASLAKGLSAKEQQLLDWKLEGRDEGYIADQIGYTKAGVRTLWHRLKKRLVRKLK